MVALPTFLVISNAVLAKQMDVADDICLLQLSSIAIQQKACLLMVYSIDENQGNRSSKARTRTYLILLPTRNDILAPRHIFLAATDWILSIAIALAAHGDLC